LSAALAAGCSTPFHVSDATLRLWLQLWDAQIDHLLGESTGEVTVAASVVRQDSTVSLDVIVQKLWSRMIKDDLLGGKSGSWRCP